MIVKRSFIGQPSLPVANADIKAYVTHVTGIGTLVVNRIQCNIRITVIEKSTRYTDTRYTSHNRAKRDTRARNI